MARSSQSMTPPSPGDPLAEGGYSYGSTQHTPAEQRTPTDWVNMARWCHDDGENWLNQAQRRQWEANIRLYKSMHPSGSKYHSEDYKNRSALFRPKTRSAVMRSEAQTAGAFFTTDDVVSLRPMDDSDPMQLGSADIWQHVVNYRCSSSIPWFKLVIGARQDAEVMGICISKQYWRYEKTQSGRVQKDQPWIRLIPAENLRISPASDWLDPINSSPYLIEKVPMFVGDVRQRMLTPNQRTGQPDWYWVDDGVLMKARDVVWDATRQAREGRGQDPKSMPASLREHDIVWIHENFLKVDGEDWVFWTAGTWALLSDPVPADQVYSLGDERPYTMGCGVIEAHRVYPAARVELLQPLQQELNEITNSRMDNVKLAVNARYWVRRGQEVDLASLHRNTPGAITLVKDVEKDIKVDRPSDVTASAFQEQDRLSVEFDELGGLFSPSSVQSNRKLNETVGGMNLMTAGANQMGEYAVGIFARTWVEPTIRQLVKLEQAFETDLTLIAIAAKKSKMLQRFGINEITDEMLKHSLTVRVAVGMAATNPELRLQKFAAAANLVGQLVGPMVRQRIMPDEIIKEVFGHAGYTDGLRFFSPPGTMVGPDGNPMPVPEGMGMPGMPPMPGQPGAPGGPGGAGPLTLPDGTPLDPDTIKTLHAAALADKSHQAEEGRKQRSHDAEMERATQMHGHKQNLELASAFAQGGGPGGGSPPSLPAPAGPGGGVAPQSRSPAGAAPGQPSAGGGGGSPLDRLNRLFDQTDKIGQAIGALLQHGQSMQGAVEQMAHAVDRMAQGMQGMHRAHGDGRAADGRRFQRIEQGVGQIIGHQQAPRRVVHNSAGEPHGVQVGDGPVRPFTKDANGRVTGLE